MPLYNFRLRFNFSEAYRIGSDLDQLELLVLPHGEKITLRSGANETPIKDHARVAIIGGPYNSEHLARTAAEKSKLALLYWAVEKRLGIDFGDAKQIDDGKQKIFVSEEYLAIQQKNMLTLSELKYMVLMSMNTIKNLCLSTSMRRDR